MKRKERFVFLGFFIPLLVTGMITADDYGIPWDDYRERVTGFFAYNYLMEGDDAIFDYQDRHYGTAFQLPLVFLEKMMRLQTTREIYVMRHYATFLFFYFSCVTFYFLSKKLLNSWPFALVAVGFLVVSPRIFAHAFYNTKDIVFMGMFIVSFYTMMVFMEKRTFPSLLLHAASSAYLVDIRVVGLAVPFFTSLWMVARFVHDKETSFVLKRGALYLAAFVCFSILFWPYLWPDPLGHFVAAFIHMSWYSNVIYTLYRGEYVLANALPWHYLPVWMLITIPPMYLFFFFVGAAGIVFGFTGNVKSFLLERTEDLLVMTWFFGFIILVTVLGSTLYDDWRQLFFVYPALVIISVKGLRMAWNASSGRGAGLRATLRAGLVFSLAVNMAVVLWFMSKHHPHGNVYFNILAGRDYKNISNNFEMDYWGVSYRQALEQIVRIDNRDEIIVFAANDPGVLNSLILPEKDRERIWFTKIPNEADYFITNYRWQKNLYDLNNEMFSVKVKGAKIVSVFKMDASISDRIDPEHCRRFFEYFDKQSGY